ncbi:MAG: GNAT family N-acetyltransferase [Rhizonema sp. PD37]|nr:GNAT family N-acetyltransferase [Rhizonema sp. PD37]
MVEVRPVKNEQELSEMFYQRWLVLRAPLAMPEGTEKDSYEDSAFHLVALCDHLIVGSARLRLLSPEIGSIAYVAILPEFRNQGIGTSLMEKLVFIAIEKKLHTLRLMARKDVINFYKRLGFVPKGEFFDYLDVPHIFMYYKLSDFFQQPRDSLQHI